MRIFFIVALAATLVGCSHQPAQRQAVAESCTPNQAFGCLTKAPDRPQLEHARFNASAPGPEPIPAKVAKAKSPPHHRARANVRTVAKPKHAIKPALKRVGIAAKAASSIPPIPRARPSKAHLKLDGSGGAASTGRPKVANSHPVAASAAISNGNTIELQVAAATAMAEQMTLAMAGAAQAKRNNSRSESEAAPHGEASQAIIGSADNTDLRVAVLLVRPEIRSLSDLTGKNIAIDEKYSRSSGDVRVAIVAAGAPVVEVTSGQTAAINRLINGEVPAAVLALVSADAAEVFPEIVGFRIFHIPLSPRSSNARP